MADEYLKIDLSELSGLINHMRHIHTEENFQKLMYRALARTGTHVRKTIRETLPKDYEVKPMYVQKHIGKAQTTFTGSSEGVRCIIPLSGERGVLGDQFKAGVQGGSNGKGFRRGRMSKAMKRGKVKYGVNTKLVTSGISTLPDKMKNQGGNPPFIMFSQIRRIPLVMTRTQRRNPANHNKQILAKVVGLNVPHMPLNRSREEVQKETIEMLEKRILQEHDVIMKGLATK